jgi:gamma-glutamylputrescine oxidase
MGMPIQFWDRERVNHELGTEVYHGGIFEPNAAEINPMTMVHALKKSAESVGVEIYENSPVQAVQPGETIRLTVGGKDVTPLQVAAKALVLGTNGYSPANGFLKSKIFTLHTEMAATSVLQDSVFDEIGWKNRLTFHDDNTLLYHVGSTQDNRILIGAGNAEYFIGNNPVYQIGLEKQGRTLFAELTRLWPALERTSFELVWSGVLSATLDLAPSIGIIGNERNIYFGAGFAGHGVNFSFLSGKVIGSLYAGNDEQWKDMPFANRNHFPIPPEPIRWLGIKSYMAFLRFGDYLK